MTPGEQIAKDFSANKLHLSDHEQRFLATQVDGVVGRMREALESAAAKLSGEAKKSRLTGDFYHSDCISSNVAEDIARDLRSALSSPAQTESQCRCGRPLVGGDPDPWCSGCNMSATGCDCVGVSPAGENGEGSNG